MPSDEASPAVTHLDLHTHILPGVDDGPETLDESLELIAVAVQQGAVGIAATPHRSPWKYREPRAAMQRRLDELQQACLNAGLRVDLYLGGETFLIPELVQINNGIDLITFNESRYLFFELPFEQFPPYVDEVLFKLEVQGYKPVMAHAERYTRYHQDVNQIVPLLERGVLAQLNAGSLAGEYGSTVKHTAQTMLEHGMAHLVASDAHSADKRPPTVAPNYGRLVEIVGAEVAESLVLDVPRKIVRDEDVEVPEPTSYRPRHFWQMWRESS